MVGRGDLAHAGGPEAARIAFLIHRDGLPAARIWVQRTLQIYRAALADPRGHAATSYYRPRFEASIEAFDSWLRNKRPKAMN